MKNYNNLEINKKINKYIIINNNKLKKFKNFYFVFLFYLIESNFYIL